MASIPERLELQTAREAALIEKLNRRFARELATVLRFTSDRVRRLVEEFRATKGRLVSTRANLGRALRLQKEIRAALEEAGFAGMAQAAVNQPFDDLAELVLKGSKIAQAAAEMTPADLKTISAFKSVRYDELLGVEERLVTQLQRTVLDGTLGLRPVDELVIDVADVFDLSDRQARTLYDTALSVHSRQVDQLNASGQPDELFYYAGPLDIKTRPFCRQRVGKVFTREELETADNGQLPNPLLTGGGYNCRHVAKRVTKFDTELQALAESGDRAPHVQEQLDALEERKAA